MPAPKPEVGVGVLILRDNRVLLGQRQGSHGADTWAPPGGHLEFGESVEACARREVLEETGLELDTVRPGPYTSDLFTPEGRHYVTLFVVAGAAAGEPQAREPGKCRGWHWFAWSELPEPLFLPQATLKREALVRMALPNQRLKLSPPRPGRIPVVPLAYIMLALGNRSAAEVRRRSLSAIR